MAALVSKALSEALGRTLFAVALVFLVVLVAVVSVRASKRVHWPRRPR